MQVSGDYEGVSVVPLTVNTTDVSVRGVEVSETSLAVPEGSSGTYTVVLTSQPTDDVTISVADSLPGTDVLVDFRTIDGTATARPDYMATEGTLTFPAETTVAQTVEVTVVDDSADESDQEFLVEGSEPSGFCVAEAEALCLQDSRYAVHVAWWTAAGRSRAGPSRPGARRHAESRLRPAALRERTDVRDRHGRLAGALRVLPDRCGLLRVPHHQIEADVCR